MCTNHLTRIQNVSPIQADDMALFREMFETDRICHANSWLYMLRATRDDKGGFGFKYWEKGVLIGIGYRNHTAYLIHPIGNRRYDVVLDLCRQMAHISNIDIVLRRLDEHLYVSLLDTGNFKHVASPLALEDDSYPETIVDVEKLVANNLPLNKRARKLWIKAKRFEREYDSLSVRTNFSEQELQAILSALHRLSDNIHDKYTSYAQMLTEVIRNKSDLYRLSVFYKDDEIHGIYLVELLDAHQVGLYCAVTSKAFPGMTEWIDNFFFRSLYDMKIKTVYLGGSETQGVYEYVKKLLPSFPPYRMYSLVYSPQNE